MKTIYFPILLLIVTSCSSIPKIPLDDSYEKIIEVQGVSKDKLYIKTNAWFVEVFNSAESVIEFQDKEEGRVIGKYRFEERNGADRYRTIISIEIKENKVRIKFYDPVLEIWSHSTKNKFISSYGVTSRNWFLSKIFIPQWNLMAESLKSKLNESDDW